MGVAVEHRKNARTWIRYRISAYPWTINPKQLQKWALEMLTQGQICELHMASYLEGFGWNLWQQQIKLPSVALWGIGLERALGLWCVFSTQSMLQQFCHTENWKLSYSHQQYLPTKNLSNHRYKPQNNSCQVSHANAAEKLTRAL